MLHPALAHDPTFLRRFQAEAQAAAALNHPNVLAVYDWGQRRACRSWSPSTWRAAACGRPRQRPAAVALPGAGGRPRGGPGPRTTPTRRGFVHRDVKPANLLFGEDRRLRIADFGLARALAEAAWTEPEGVVLGTARYVSPEQAAGGSLDGRSDVYSLALVLVEAVTGAVPHTADTALGSLRARIGRSIEAPAELGPLGPIVEAAGRADPAERSSAAELGRALMAVAGHCPAPSRCRWPRRPRCPMPAARRRRPSRPRSCACRASSEVAIAGRRASPSSSRRVRAASTARRRRSGRPAACRRHLRHASPAAAVAAAPAADGGAVASGVCQGPARPACRAGPPEVARRPPAAEATVRPVAR